MIDYFGLALREFDQVLNGETEHYDYRQIYRENFGKIPKGHHVHHIDCNHSNNIPWNLIALDPRFHNHIHQRICEGEDSLLNRERIEEEYEIWKKSIKRIEIQMQNLRDEYYFLTRSRFSRKRKKSRRRKRAKLKRSKPRKEHGTLIHPTKLIN